MRTGAGLQTLYAKIKNILNKNSFKICSIEMPILLTISGIKISEVLIHSYKYVLSYVWKLIRIFFSVICIKHFPIIKTVHVMKQKRGQSFKLNWFILVWLVHVSETQITYSTFCHRFSSTTIIFLIYICPICNNSKPRLACSHGFIRKRSCKLPVGLVDNKRLLLTACNVKRNSAQYNDIIDILHQ